MNVGILAGAGILRPSEETHLHKLPIVETDGRAVGAECFLDLR